MYICVCHAVTDRDIREAAESGVRSMRQLRQTTGCSGSCGQCATMAKELLDQHAAVPALMFPAILEPNPA